MTTEYLQLSETLKSLVSVITSKVDGLQDQKKTGLQKQYLKSMKAILF